VIDRTYGIEEFIANLGIAAHRDGFASKVKMATAGSQTDTKIMHPEGILGAVDLSEQIPQHLNAG
jgi:hypothetical protein